MSENQEGVDAPDGGIVPAADASLEKTADEGAKAPSAEAEAIEPSPEQIEAEKAAEEDRRQKRRERRERSRQAKREKLDALERIRGQNAGEPPKEEDFTDYNDFVAARAVYAYRTEDRTQAVTEAEAHAKEAEEAERAAIQEEWAAQATAAKAKYADFEQVAYTAPISDEVADVIATSEMGAEIAYHLGKHPDQAARISSLHPVDAAREIGRIEARFSAPPPPKQTTTAPPPPKPLGGAGGDVDPSKMSMAEYTRWRARGGAS